LRHRYKVMTLTPSVRAMSLCSFPCVTRPFACASFVAISALECLLFLAIAACIRPSPCCYKFSLWLGGTKRASYYQPAINMINMRVGGYVIPRITYPKFIRATKIERREANIESAVSIYRPQCCSAQKGTAHWLRVPFLRIWSHWRQAETPPAVRPSSPAGGLAVCTGPSQENRKKLKPKR